jgi:hypothetical protein
MVIVISFDLEEVLDCYSLSFLVIALWEEVWLLAL